MTLHNPVNPPGANWSASQLIRLENEWRRLQRSFAYHPLLQVIPLSGDPPTEYQVQFKVTTLALNQANQLTYITSCPVHIWLPPQFPHAPPTVRPMTPVFHPNVTMDWIYLNPPWNPNMTLVQLVTQVGRVLAYHTWDTEAVANQVAMDWLGENQHLIPTDPTANFAIDADAEPLARIMRYGAETIEQIRARLKKMCDRLVSVPTPGMQETRRFAQQTRLAVSLFSEADVPDHLRESAAELDEVALSMMETHNPWEALGRHFTVANATAQAAENAAQAAESVRQARDALAKLAPPDVAEDAIVTLSQMPALSVLQPLLLTLRRSVRDAEQKVGNLKVRIGELDSEAANPPGVEGTPGNMLYDRLEAEQTRAAEVVTAARRRAAEALAEAEPIAQARKRELAGAERIVEWAEYADLISRADALVKRIIEMGPIGIQSFVIQFGDDLLGPFEYEQRLDPYGLRLSVTNLGGTKLDVLDTRSGQVMAHGEGGELIANLRSKSGDPVPLAVRPSEHTDELRVQLEYLVTQTKEKYARLSALSETAASDAWIGQYEAALRTEKAAEQLGAAYKHQRQVWKGLLLDLVALGKFKLRIGTYYQLERVAELVPRVRKEIEKAEASLAVATRRLSDIATKSSRDMETDRLIIPRQLIKEYGERVAERERAQRDIPRFKKLIADAAQQVRARLASGRLIGVAGAPAFYVLPPGPEEWAQLDAAVADPAMLARVGALEASLGTAVRPEKPIFEQPAPPPAAPAGEQPEPAREMGVEAAPQDAPAEDTIAGEEAPYATEDQAYIEHGEVQDDAAADDAWVVIEDDAPREE